MAIWQNTQIRGLLEVTDRYYISEANYNTAMVEVSGANGNETQIYGDNKINTTLTGKNSNVLASNGNVEVKTLSNGTILIRTGGTGDITIENSNNANSVVLNTNHLVLRGANTFTWGTSNPITNGAKQGQIYFKIIS